jgi:hypothetical protein
MIFFVDSPKNHSIIELSFKFFSTLITKRQSKAENLSENVPKDFQGIKSFHSHSDEKNSQIIAFHPGSLFTKTGWKIDHSVTRFLDDILT